MEYLISRRKNLIANNIQINLEKELKDIFNNPENDPKAINGISAKSENNITTVKKGTFTSCNDDSDCPWK